MVRIAKKSVLRNTVRERIRCTGGEKIWVNFDNGEVLSSWEMDLRPTMSADAMTRNVWSSVGMGWYVGCKFGGMSNRFGSSGRGILCFCCDCCD